MRYHFGNRRHLKRVPFHLKMVYKRVRRGLDLRAASSRMKPVLSTPSSRAEMPIFIAGSL